MAGRSPAHFPGPSSTIQRGMAADLDPSLVRTFRGHRGPVTSIDFAPDLRYLASGSADKCIMLWNLEPKLRAFRFVGHTVRRSVAAARRGGAADGPRATRLPSPTWRSAPRAPLSPPPRKTKLSGFGRPMCTWAVPWARGRRR